MLAFRSDPKNNLQVSVSLSPSPSPTPLPCVPILSLVRWKFQVTKEREREKKNAACQVLHCLCTIIASKFCWSYGMFTVYLYWSFFPHISPGLDLWDFYELGWMYIESFEFLPTWDLFDFRCFFSEMCCCVNLEWFWQSLSHTSVFSPLFFPLEVA